MTLLNSKYIKDIEFPVNFTSAKDLYLALALVEEEKERLSLSFKEVQEAKEPTVVKSSYRVIGDTKDCITIKDLSKNLNVEGMGPLNLFKFLRQEGLLLSTNIPHPNYQQYFTLVRKYNPISRDSYDQTLVNTLGFDLILKKLKAAGYIIPKAA